MALRLAPSMYLAPGVLMSVISRTAVSNTPWVDG